MALVFEGEANTVATCMESSLSYMLSQYAPVDSITTLSSMVSVAAREDIPSPSLSKPNSSTTAPRSSIMETLHLVLPTSIPTYLIPLFTLLFAAGIGLHSLMRAPGPLP